MPTRLPESLVVSSGPRFSHSPDCTKRLSAHEAAAGHHDEAERDVGDVVGEHVRRVGHLDAALPAVVDRHAVVAHAEHRDDLELRQRVEQRRRRDRAAALHEAADARALRREQSRLVARLVVVVAVVVGLQRIVEERRQRRGDDDVGLGHGCLSAGRVRAGCRANHSSNPAMSPASAPPVSTASKPRLARMFGDARMRHERRELPQPAQIRRRRAARTDCRGLRSTSASARARAPAQRLAQALPRRSRARRGDSIRRKSTCAPRARSVSPRWSRPPSPRKIAMRLPATSRNSGSASRPSLSNVVAGIRTSAMPVAASAAAVPGPGANVQQRGRPSVGRGHAVLDGVGGDEDRDVVAGERRVRAVERRRDRRAAGSRSRERRSAWRRAPPSCRASPAAWRAGRVTITPTPASGPRGAGACDGGCALTTRLAASGRDEARGAARKEVVGQRAVPVVRRLRHPPRPPRRRRAGRPCRRAPRATRAATACLPPIPRRRRAACGSCRPARAKTRAPPWWRASCRNRPAAPARRRCWRGRCGTRARARPGRARAGCRPGSSSDAMREPKPSRLRPAAARMMRVVPPLVELAQSRVDVAAQRLDAQMRMALAQLRFAAQARRADHGVLRQVGERRVAIGHERIARVLARGDRGERESRRHLHRHVLQRMHGEVGAALVHRDLEFLDEQALAADRRERLVEDAVALRGQSQQVDDHAGILRDEPRADVLGLPQRERRFARRDPQAARHRYRERHPLPPPSRGI